MRQTAGSLKIGAMAVTLTVVMGCAHTEATRFFQLRPEAVPAMTNQPTPAVGSLVIGLNTVVLPGYLDRPQIVTRVNSNEVYVSEFKRWAEPPADTITRVLRDNLAGQIPSARVEAGPQDCSAGYRITVVIDRFEGQFRQSVSLAARWSISVPGRQRTAVQEGAGQYTETFPPAEADYGALVNAMSRLLAALSRDLAHAVVTAAAANPSP